MAYNRPTNSVYITTNSKKEVLYCGVSNDVKQRVIEHYLSRGNPDTFAGKYYCYWLVYYENSKYINNAILKEKEVKKWSRKKKEALINTINPEWKFLNFELFDKWPPSDLFHRKDL